MATTERGNQFMDALKRRHDDAERHAIELIEERDQLAAEVVGLRGRCQEQRDELIAQHARLDVIARELSIERSDHGITRRELAEQRSALEHLKRQAAGLASAAEAMLDKGAVMLPSREDMRPDNDMVQARDRIQSQIEEGLEEMRPRPEAAAELEMPAILRRLPAPVAEARS